MLISRLEEPEHLLVFPTSHRRVYWIESAPGLDTPFTPASPIFAGDGGLMTMDLPHPAELRVYYRIVATLP
jgi:hypothetical protein